MKVHAFWIAVALLLVSSCTPIEVNQTITCIDQIVDEAGSLVSTVDSLDSRVSLSERTAALKLAETASRASWLALSEANSKDSISKKNEKIASYLGKVRIADHSIASNWKLQAKEDDLAEALVSVRQQLDNNSAALSLHPDIGDMVPTPSIFSSTTRRVEEIKYKASQTITAANLLLESLQ